MDDEFDFETALCDGGMVTSGAMFHGVPYPCTGHAHFMGSHIRCTDPSHAVKQGEAWKQLRPIETTGDESDE